jgi:hypothetical protein
MKAETATAAVEGPESDAGTIDETESNTTSSGAETTTLQASSSSIKSAGQPPTPDATKTQGSLTGKINNLFTTDLG